MLYSNQMYYNFDNLLIHCFSCDETSLFCPSSWIEYGYKKWEIPICLGFRESKLHTISNVTGILENIIDQQDFFPPYHISSKQELVFSCGVKYCTKEELNKFSTIAKKIEDIEISKNTFFLTYEDQKEKHLMERRLLVKGFEPSRFIKIDTINLNSIFFAPGLQTKKTKEVMSKIPEDNLMQIFSMYFDSKCEISVERIR